MHQAVRRIVPGIVFVLAGALVSVSDALAIDHRLCSKFLGQEFWRTTEVGISDRGGIILHPNRRRYLSYENEGFQEIIRTPLSFSFLQVFSGKPGQTPAVEIRTFIRRRNNGDLESIELTHNANKAILMENARRRLRGEKLLADRVSRLVRYRFEERNGVCVPSEVSVERYDSPGMVESAVVRSVVMNLALCREIDGVERSKDFGRNWDNDATVLRAIWFKYQKAYEIQHSSLQAFEGRSRAEWNPTLFELGRMKSETCDAIDLGYGFPKGHSVLEVLANEEVYPNPAVRPSSLPSTGPGVTPSPVASAKPVASGSPLPVASASPSPAPKPKPDSTIEDF